MKVIWLFAMMIISVRNNATQDKGVEPNTETPLQPLEKDKLDKENTIFQEQDEVKKVFELDEENF